VLSGAFESAFASEGVQFEPELGSFRIRPALQGSIRVHGNGPARVWTARALERAGYRIVEGEASTAVVVASEGTGNSWSIEGSARARCESIESLVETLGAIQLPGR
jgi:iron complex transport system ATP-binding protein